MENDLIQFLFLSLVIGTLGMANLYILARGLPVLAEAYEAFWATVIRVAPILRRLFDPGTRLAKMLQAKGVDPKIADMFAEWGADMIENIAKPYLPEEATPSGG